MQGANAFVFKEENLVCLKMTGKKDNRQLSMFFNRPSVNGDCSNIMLPDFSNEHIKVFESDTSMDDGINYANQYDNDGEALLHALADLLGYKVTPIEDEA